MKKEIIICDACRKVIEDPVAKLIIGEKEQYDICPKCIRKLFIKNVDKVIKKPVKKEKQAFTDKEKAKAPTIKSLAKAGWSADQIALDPMVKLSVESVNRVLEANA